MILCSRDRGAQHVNPHSHSYIKQSKFKITSDMFGPALLVGKNKKTAQTRKHIPVLA